MKSMEECNYYELLEIPEDAPKTVVREAFFATRSLFDHDSLVSYNFLSEPEREALLDRLQEAYETLMDDHKRMAYDRKVFHRVGRWHIPSAVASPAPVCEDAGPAPAARPHVRLQDFHRGSGPLRLTELREAAGVSLEEVSRVTRIRLPLLRALEEKNLRKLPPAIYVKGYLRAYAEILGVDPQGLVRAYGPLHPGEE